jgi:hypothetical protein
MQGPALKEAEGKLAAPMPEPLAPYQRGFIQASLDERDRTERATQAAEAQRRREKEELQQRERDALALAAEGAPGTAGGGIGTTGRTGQTACGGTREADKLVWSDNPVRHRCIRQPSVLPSQQPT